MAEAKKTNTKKTEKKTAKPAEKKSSAKSAKSPKKQAKGGGESFEFQSEVKQLLNILVYSLYKNKEVFLRELISNSVDALNKIQFETLTNSDIEDKDLDLKIEITTDEDKNKLIIEDTGVGMTHEELVENLGTIAHSGTLDFVKKLSESDSTDNTDLIGQFGVGFYSAFMVSDEIHVHTRSYQKGSKGLLWKSEGSTSYTIEEKDKHQRGTRIELFLKEDDKGFLRDFRLKSVINQHSRFVPFPILLDSERIESVEAIWTEPRNNLKEEDYHEFFRFFQGSKTDPESYLHLSADAPLQFNAILYIPTVNTEVYGWIKQEPGMDLYSRKILIQKHCPDILPIYFRFVKGVVDSEDIPLNISRESFQTNKQIETIRKYLMKKLLEHLKKIKTTDMEQYLRIWNNFSKNFKEGIPNEYDFREELAALMLFESSKTPKEEHTDLEQYVERMKSDQFEIYYAVGDNFDAVDGNPAVEVFKKRDLEVLYLDPMGAWSIGNMHSYKGKIFRAVESVDMKLSEEEEKDLEALKDAENFIEYMRTVYEGKLHTVRLSKRLVDSPCMLVNSPTAANIPMDQKMREQRKRADFSKKIMEVNRENKLIAEMIAIHKKEPDSKLLRLLAGQLLDNLILREGIIEDIEHIVPRIHDLMYEAAKQ